MPLSRRWIVLLVAASVAVPLVGSAQPRAISLWLGAGRPVTRDSISFSVRNLDAYGAVQLDVPLLPFAVRGDLSLAGGELRTGTRNVSASLIFPLRLPLIQPYGMLGYGIYDWGKALEDRGTSYGAGVRLQLGGFGFFGQVRRHSAIDRTVGTVGLVF